MGRVGVENPTNIPIDQTTAGVHAVKACITKDFLMTRALHIAALGFACLTPAAVFAQSLSAEVGTAGLDATAARLEGIASPTPEDLFALGALRFLGAIEGALQARWQAGISENMMFLPVLRLPIPENPNAGPLDPALITTLFTDISGSMEAARAPLLAIPANADFGVEIAFADIWFDINANGARDAGEDLADTLGPILMGWQWDARDPATPLPVVRFDAADAAWLTAYTHLLHGISDTVVAYSPTAAITRMQETRTALGLAPGQTALEYYGIDEAADAVSVVVAENRRFWGMVTAESDNDREWLPNDGQQSALGVALPPGTGPTWMAVLADGEALLNGKALIPYWRLADGRGVNLRRMFTEPAPIDLVGWFQGYAAVPYIEEGRTVGTTNWMAFEQMMAGDSLLFTVFLN
jgi:hypothetical protein